MRIDGSGSAKDVGKIEAPRKRRERENLNKY